MTTAIILTILAWLSTAIWWAMVFFTKQTNTKFLSGSLWFSAGVMIFISLVEIFQKSKIAFIAEYWDKVWFWYTLAAFFGWIAIIAIIDYLIPSTTNPHELHDRSDSNTSVIKKTMMKTGMITALAIGIHNMPEWFVTFLWALEDPSLWVALAIAIAIHNIPEWIAVSVPIYYATGSKRKWFRWSVVSWLAEPLWAIAGFFLLKARLWDTIYGIMFGVVAGIMVFISLDELLPSAHKYGHHHITIYWLMIWMLVMAISLGLFVV